MVVGNISAGSGGPGNWLAYGKEYGFFGADIVVLVISSHDYADNPTYSVLNENTHLTQTPLSALVEGVVKYLPKYLPQINPFRRKTKPHNFVEADEREVERGLVDLMKFLEIARVNSGTVLVFQHWEKSEIANSSPKPGNGRIKKLCKSMGFPPISLMPYFLRSIESGMNPFRGNIHPNDTGQQLLADAILENM